MWAEVLIATRGGIKTSGTFGDVSSEEVSAWFVLEILQ